MTISTLEQLATARRDFVRFCKLTWNTTCNNNGPWGDPIHSASGDPGAVSAVSDTTSGVVPTNATAGYPQFTISSTGYIANIEGECISSTAGTQVTEPTRFLVYDRLFEAGPFVGAHAAYTLSSQPSFASRVPNTDYSGLLLLMTLGGTGSSGGSGNLVISYLDGDGNSKTTTRTFAGGTQVTTFSCTEILPLAGNRGIQKITSVDPSVITNGNVSVNLVIARPLFMGFINDAARQTYATSGFGMEQIGFPLIYSTSAICVLQSMNRGTTFCGDMDLIFDIAS